MDASTTGPQSLEELVARLWSGGAEGRERLWDLLVAIETVAPAAIDRAHARRISRQLKLPVTPVR